MSDSSFFKDTKNAVQQYVADRMLLFKMQTAEKGAKLVTVLVSGLIIGLFGFFILFFISIMVGYYFGELLGSLYLGFAIVAASYALLLLVLLRIKSKYLDAIITNKIIEVFFSGDDENEQNEGNQQ